MRRIVVVLFGMAAVCYTGAFLHASLSSTERVLTPGTAYHFCGFYLDCHLSASVDGVRIEHSGQGAVRYVVRLRLANDARRATLALHQVQVTLLDDDGIALESLVGPTGVRLSPDSSTVSEFVFESPAPLAHPRLLVRKGGWQERLSELFLIGDPDSWLHAPVTLELPSALSP